MYSAEWKLVSRYSALVPKDLTILICYSIDAPGVPAYSFDTTG